MNRALFTAALLLAAAPAAAQPADWSRAQQVTVTLSNFAYAPETIRLRRGQPYRLHFVNAADGGHNFVAREFFAAATVAAEDRARVDEGVIELGGGASGDVRLRIDAPGRYEVHCSHFMHTTFGMSGEILVE
ncbi:MAG: cupredoxin domain-containing protein [Sphingomonadaceae bacterium]|nr:cupredoxin domain-containing protein [Sphingomonadaceae bacterium]